MPDQIDGGEALMGTSLAQKAYEIMAICRKADMPAGAPEVAMWTIDSRLDVRKLAIRDRPLFMRDLHAIR
jgi:hypothetical protein